LSSRLNFCREFPQMPLEKWKKIIMPTFYRNFLPMYWSISVSARNVRYTATSYKT
jgi:hypothetical protein